MPREFQVSPAGHSIVMKSAQGRSTFKAAKMGTSVTATSCLRPRQDKLRRRRRISRFYLFQLVRGTCISVPCLLPDLVFKPLQSLAQRFETKRLRWDNTLLESRIIFAKFPSRQIVNVPFHLP